MKKSINILILCSFAAILLGGCAMAAAPVMGGLYTDVKAPVTATNSDAPPMKSGMACATSILGIIATGDASIEAAAKNGGITKIHHVDYHTQSVLGLYAKYTVTVYGN